MRTTNAAPAIAPRAAPRNARDNHRGTAGEHTEGRRPELICQCSGLGRSFRNANQVAVTGRQISLD